MNNIVFFLLFLSLFSYTSAQTECKDSATNCAVNIRSCNTGSYITVMRKYCPLTCGYCKVGNPLFDPITSVPIGQGASVGNGNTRTCYDMYSR